MVFADWLFQFAIDVEVRLMWRRSMSEGALHQIKPLCLIISCNLSIVVLHPEGYYTRIKNGEVLSKNTRSPEVDLHTV
jgi:hypothetical protein